MTRLRVSRQASVGFMPRRMNSTVSIPPHTLMFDSPRPVEPAAPTSLSVYCPAPMTAESPTRPGILNARPAVVVIDEISLVGVTASQLIVPVGRATMFSDSGTSRKSSLGLRLARHASHFWRECSVRRSSSLKPYDSAKRLAPSPTKNTLLVYLRTSFATSDGVLMFSRQPTALARFVGPCMHDASSCTTPRALGSPPYPTESSFGSSSWIFTASTHASRVSAPCMSRSNAFCTPRMPLALAMTTGFDAQRLRTGSGFRGRMACGMANPAPAASVPADVTNSRRDSASDTDHSDVKKC